MWRRCALNLWHALFIHVARTTVQYQCGCCGAAVWETITTRKRTLCSEEKQQQRLFKPLLKRGQSFSIFYLYLARLVTFPSFFFCVQGSLRLDSENPKLLFFLIRFRFLGGKFSSVERESRVPTRGFKDTNFLILVQLST